MSAQRHRAQGIRSPPRSSRTSHQGSNAGARPADHEDTLASRNTIDSFAEGSHEDANSSSARGNAATAEIGVADGHADGSEDDSPPELDVELSRRMNEEVYDTEEVKAALRDLSRECFLAWREAAAMRHARRISNMDVDSRHGESHCLLTLGSSEVPTGGPSATEQPLLACSARSTPCILRLTSRSSKSASGCSMCPLRRHSALQADQPLGSMYAAGSDASADKGGGAPDVLYLGLDNSLARTAGKPLCRLTLFAAYWLDNRTGLDLSFQDHESAPRAPILLGARLPCDTTSVLAPGDACCMTATLEGSAGTQLCLPEDVHATSDEQQRPDNAEAQQLKLPFQSCCWPQS